jgi:hypothetical protein
MRRNEEFRELNMSRNEEFRELNMSRNEEFRELNMRRSPHKMRRMGTLRLPVTRGKNFVVRVKEGFGDTDSRPGC